MTDAKHFTEVVRTQTSMIARSRNESTMVSRKMVHDDFESGVMVKRTTGVEYTVSPLAVEFVHVSRSTLTLVFPDEFVHALCRSVEPIL